MPKYIETAREANNCATALMEYIVNYQGDINHDFQVTVAESIARLVNYGIRCSPRPVQSTVRLNAVREAVRGLPVKVRLEERTDEVTGKTYKVLITEPTNP